jgi:hypothetical protein
MSRTEIVIIIAFVLYREGARQLNTKGRSSV